MKVQQKYIELIEQFLSKRISVSEFERAYLDTFSDERTPLGELYELLNWLFTEVDAYTDLPIGPDEDATQFIDEEQLRKSAAEVLEDLKKLGK
jgi:hypothetical protein